MLAAFCGICGLQFQPDDMFCARCGAPRDTNMSEATALQIFAPIAPTILSSNPQTFCINCGQPRSANVFPCPFCNSSIPTIQTQMPIAQQMATTAPTPPLIIKKPTPQQIYNAMLGTVNPYGFGLWGDLVVDGSRKNIWDFPILATWIIRSRKRPLGFHRTPLFRGQVVLSYRFRRGIVLVYQRKHLYWLLGTSVRKSHRKSDRACLHWLQKNVQPR